MSEITIRKQYEFYIDTIQSCTSSLLSRSDEEVLHKLFEEFDIGAISFLHDDTLARLSRAGYLDYDSLRMSQELRMRWLALESVPWAIEDIRNAKEWQELFELGDRLNRSAKALLNR